MNYQITTLLENTNVKDTEIVKDHRETYDIPDEQETIIFKVEQVNGEEKKEEIYLCLELNESTPYNENNIVIFFDNQSYEVIEIVTQIPV